MVGGLSEFSPDYPTAEAERTTPHARILGVVAADADDADVQGYKLIWNDEKLCGFCTSGGYSHPADPSIALGLIPRGLVQDGLRTQIEILGQMRNAVLITTQFCDPDGALMRI
ncbi:glycine cleavage T C-terminal barrel domain-containing protein [Marivita sp. S0852]|uniref:glycine cleavage T C-terminal barrel domain-containing protein n=1 Tax=Marivita sp. S0852 TaxID=3373893 RepID=UPI00398293CF